MGINKEEICNLDYVSHRVQALRLKLSYGCWASGVWGALV